jgi:SulP family sulfate permease
LLRRYVSVLEWLPGYRRADLPGDLIAGLTGAAILVPQGMAYAQIAGLPPVVGLYASVLPLVAYALLGRSRQLGVGPLASISVLSAVGVASLAPQGSAEFVALSASLAVLVGAVHLVIGVGRLGFLARFLSEPVMKGFLAGVGALIIATELGGLTGISVPSSGEVPETVEAWLDAIDGVSASATALGIVSIAVLLFTRRWRRFPTALVLLVVATGVSAIFDFAQHGIPVVGAVPSGLAGPEIPPLHWGDLDVLLPTAVAITFVSILESLALAREYADEHGYDIDPDDEIAALGAANVTSGFFQGMVVTGAMTRSAILDEAGARTQLSLVISAAVVAPLLVFGTEAFEPIPVPVLAAIVVVAVVPFLDVAEAKRLWGVSKPDFWVMMVTFAGTTLLGVELGVALAVTVSILLIVVRVSMPRMPELGRVPGLRPLLPLSTHPDAQAYEGAVVLRVDAPLWFSNADALRARVRQVEQEHPDLESLVLDMGGVDALDSTADHELRKLAARCRARGITLLLLAVPEPVREVLDASGFTAQLGADAYVASYTDLHTRLTGTPLSP